MSQKEVNYWVVGASWGGIDHQDERFVNEKFWMLGWEKDDQPSLYAAASQIAIGDRIAIKRMKGKGQTGIRILHIGIVMGVILDNSRIVCTVDWCATNLDRDVEDSKGCFKAIHGPYQMSSHGDWLRQIFSL